ncbi:MAG: hypothetical protein AMK73_06100 [Planctomycetes bacterium SM23_32]|nr:MAG: hypothetical protein AMK73_06100 [Planctomycetes bacterium SM23_32]
MSESGKRRRQGGFTLVELLVAMTLVIIFGSMAVAVLRYGVGLWRAGHRRSHAYDVAATVFHQLESDLNAARGQFWGADVDAYDTRVKFYVDLESRTEAGFVPDAGRQRLRFVRGIADEAVNPRVRQAGDGVDNDGDGATDEEFYNGLDDDGDSRIDEDLMPLEGMCEVAYLMGLGAADYNTLYRAVLAPIGGVAPGGTPADFAGYSLLRDDPSDADNDVFASALRIAAKARPLAHDILHFEVRCWSQYTTTWVPEPFVVWSNPDVPEICGPAFTWDSDRLRPTWTPPPPWRANPPFYMDWDQPGFQDTDDDEDGSPNSADEDYVLDNVFPRAVMVVLVVDPYEDYPVQNPLRLASDVADSDTTITVTGQMPAYNQAWPYFRIGEEWILFEDFDAETQTFAVTSGGRAMRGTTAAGHSAGELVHFGYTFSCVFHNPAGRDY